jgi:putative ABC transport system permease protein
MSEKLVPLLIKQPQVTFATGEGEEPGHRKHNHTGKSRLTSVGVFESGKLSHICARLNILQSLTGNPGRLSQIYLKVDDPARAQLVVDQLRGKMPGYFIYTMEEFTSLLTINSVGLLPDFIGVVIWHCPNCRFYSRDNGHVHRCAGKNARDRNTEGARASSGYIPNLLFRETM